MSLIRNMPTQSHQNCPGSQRTVRARIGLVDHLQTQCTDPPKAVTALSLSLTTMASLPSITATAIIFTAITAATANSSTSTIPAADGNAPDAP
ncbi:hypothetical protein SprV_0100190000 [Sparganum proliferum]